MGFIFVVLLQKRFTGLNFMLARLVVCIISAGITLYLLTSKQNALIELQIAIPAVKKEVNQLREENNRIQFEIDQFENPIALLELSKKPEYSHLKFPNNDQVIHE